MNVKVYSQTGSELTLTLPTEIVDFKAPATLLHQVVVAEAANARAPHGHSKTRSTVSGGGHKPWKQKGTDQARQSSIRSPIWVGGGIAFGPKSNRNYSKQMPKMMRRQAFAAALSTQLKDDVVRVVADWGKFEGKTKEVANMITMLPDVKGKILFVAESVEPNFVLALRNIKNAYFATVESVSTSDLLRANTIITSKVGLEQLIARAFGQEIKLADTKEKTAKAAKETE